MECAKRRPSRTSATSRYLAASSALMMTLRATAAVAIDRHGHRRVTVVAMAMLATTSAVVAIVVVEAAIAI